MTDDKAPARNEVQVGFRAAGGLPAGIGEGEIYARYQRTWASRDARFEAVALEQAGISSRALEATLIEDEQLRDLFAAGAFRSRAVSDAVYREAIGRIVGAALADDARVDELAYLYYRVAALEPLQLRALGAYRLRRRGMPAGVDIARTRTVAQIAKALGVGRAITFALAQGVEAAGFIQRAAPTVMTKAQEGFSVGSPAEELDVAVPQAWRLTEWGRAVLSSDLLGLPAQEADPAEDVVTDR